MDVINWCGEPEIASKEGQILSSEAELSSP